MTFKLLTIMADSNDNLARIEAALAATTEIVQRMGERTDARLLQHDNELDDQDQRTERLERDHIEHADRMEKLEALLVEIKEERKDIRAILQMMVGRFAGEPPLGE
jgi:septal ring factor EnvC (AmiA/AmiB activator)